MTAVTFDSLNSYERLTAAGMPEAQAKAQVAIMQDMVKTYDAASRKELATKGDLLEVRTELKEDIQYIHRNIQDVRLEMKAMEIRLLKWQIGIAVALVAIMAKGFGWLGF